MIEAVVWKIGDFGPLAQLSYRGGFAFKANGRVAGCFSRRRFPIRRNIRASQGA